MKTALMTHVWVVAWVGVLLSVLQNVAPDARCACGQCSVNTLALAVEQEVAETTRKQVVGQEQQQTRSELEHSGELIHKLPHAVEELKEHRRALRVVVLGVRVADAVLELVTEGEPIFGNQATEPTQGAEVWIHEQLSHADALGSSVPAVTTMAQHGQALPEQVTWAAHTPCERHTRGG